MQDECVQYVGPYGAIPLASAALHVEVCHEHMVCNKSLGREQDFYLLWNRREAQALTDWSCAKPIFAPAVRLGPCTNF